jgi:hypothetical protein
MGGKAKSKSRLGMQKVNKLRHTYLNGMKLENCGPRRECLNNPVTSQKFFFPITFKLQKVQISPYWRGRLGTVVDLELTSLD